MEINNFENYYKGEKVIVTGHAGFKGSWLSVWLNYMGAEVYGISKEVLTNPSFNNTLKSSSIFHEEFFFDLNEIEKLHDHIKKIQPKFIFHLAAQALVRPSYENPLQTLNTNAIGTANLLDGLRFLEKPVIAVMITSDKAYDNVEWVWGYRETDSLGGKDPYSASKGMAELVIRSFKESFFSLPGSNVRIGIARAGNVIGGGDWARDRIVPDCMTAWSNNRIVDIRSPMATRPWQHVLEPLSGYLLLGADLLKSPRYSGEAYNFGPNANQNHSVSQLIDEMRQYWDKVQWNDVSKSREHVHEAGLLKLNCDKALFNLNWRPTLEFEETVKLTVEWYKKYYQNIELSQSVSMYDFTISQIKEYTQLARNRGIIWAK